MKWILFLSIFFLSHSFSYGEEKNDFEKHKHLFSSSVKESIKEAYRQKTKRQHYWTDNYQNALGVAKEKGKSVLLAFVGSDWCPWSQKLENEVLTQPEFSNILKEDLILVWIDFPENTPLAQERKEYNQKLKEKYQILELPTLVLLDSSEKQIAKLNYLPLDVTAFAGKIKGLIKDYREMSEVLETSDLVAMKIEELEALYKRAKNLGCGNYTQEIATAGLKQNRGTFFLLEKYAEVLESENPKDPQAMQLRKTIVSRDPKNSEGSHLKLAMLEFEKLSKTGKTKVKPQTAIEPLVDYIRDFGKKDKENLWRIELMIAQYLFSKGIVGKAISHASASYDSAPEAVKSEIAQSLDYLKSQNE